MELFSGRKNLLSRFLITLAASFALGVAFAYKAAIPWTLHFLMEPVGFSTPTSAPMVTDVVKLELQLIFVSGIVFSAVSIGLLWFLGRLTRKLRSCKEASHVDPTH